MLKLPSLITKSAPLMLLRRFRQRFFPRPEDIGIALDHPLRFIQKSTGVVHVGAHTGEEAWIYNSFGVPAIWVEANPSLMQRLEEEISRFPRQVAIQALLTQTAGEETDFWVTNNDGASSSTLPLKQHREMFPEIQVTSSIKLKSTTLDDLLRKHDPLRKFNAMVIDVQGAELNVLQGAPSRLEQFKWIFAECADFEIYENCCTLDSLSEWLSRRGFVEQSRYLTKEVSGIGRTYDVLFSARS